MFLSLKNQIVYRTHDSKAKKQSIYIYKDLTKKNRFGYPSYGTDKNLKTNSVSEKITYQT